MREMRESEIESETTTTTTTPTTAATTYPEMNNIYAIRNILSGI